MDHDLSLAGLFLQAAPVVKGVMLLLLLASVACWAVALDRGLRLARLRREVAGFADAVRSAAAPPRAAGAVTGAVLAAADREWRQGGEAPESFAERRERIERAMRLAAAEALRKLEPGLPLLATVGSAAPFVGLFGTVWGIMHSFAAIARSNDTSLAVVAPGIAEALFATALGLVAAIPAVIAYNKLATDLGRAAKALDAAIAALGGRMARRAPARAEAAE